MSNKATEFERELTGRESAITAGMLVVIFLLASIDESIEWGVKEYVRMGLAFLLGIGTIWWQTRCMSTPLKDEEEQQDGE